MSPTIAPADPLRGAGGGGGSGDAPDPTAPRIPRLAFKKSRGGCTRCKARKVKCDEGRPACHNCARHRAACEYVTAPTRRAANGLPGKSPQQQQAQQQQAQQRQQQAARRRGGEGGRGGSSTLGGSSAASSRRARAADNHQERDHEDDHEDEEEEEEEVEDEGGLGLSPAQHRLLEMRLLHHFVSVVAHTFSAANNPIVLDVWTKLVVRTAFTHSFLLNTVFAFTALHLISTTSRAAAGGFAPVEDSSLLPAEMVGDAAESWAGVDAERAYRVYLGLAFKQQREAIRRKAMEPENANALLFSSILLSYQALHVDRAKARRRPRREQRAVNGDADDPGRDDRGAETSEEDDGGDGGPREPASYQPPVQWLRMVRGIQQTTLALGSDVTHDAVVRFLAQQGGEPNFLDPRSLADPSSLTPFLELLDYASYPEPFDPRIGEREEDVGPQGVDETTRVAYERTLMYVGTVYAGIMRKEGARVLFRRIIGLGFATPDRFIALVEAGRPRALVIIAYHLSMASRLDHHWLFGGVAEREVRGLAGLVPAEWRWAMVWADKMMRDGLEESRRAGERARWRGPLAEGV
jgi:hypothetical protein